MWEALGGRASGADHRAPEKPSPQQWQLGPPFYPAQSSLPTHYQAFQNHEWEVVERSLRILQATDFYWGPLSVGEAHAHLEPEPVGTYLLRDSAQGNCLFSVSVKIPSGPVSLRIAFQKGHFWLQHLFSDCVVRLLEMAVEATQSNALYCQEGSLLVFSSPLRRNWSLFQWPDFCQRSLDIHGAAAPRTEQGAKEMEEDIISTSQPGQELGQLLPMINLPPHHQPK